MRSQIAKYKPGPNRMECGGPDSPKIKTITVFLNGTNRNGIYITCHELEGSLSELLDKLKVKFSKTRLKRLFNSAGAEIFELEVIENKDVLYVSEKEGFILPPGHTYDGPAVPNSIGDRIKLNVGGTIFETSRATLLGGGEDSMLSKMFDPSLPMSPAHLDGSGAYFIDRDPKYFAPILNYLRSGKLVVDQGLNATGVLEEAAFFGLGVMKIHEDDSLLASRVSKLEKSMESRGQDSEEVLLLQKTKLRIEILNSLKEKQGLFLRNVAYSDGRILIANEKFGRMFDTILDSVAK